MSLEWNISKLKSPQNPKNFKYQNKSEFIKDHYHTNTNQNQAQTEGQTPFFHIKI